MNEIARVNRTWFCTLTLDPQWQHKVFMEELAQKTSTKPYGRGGWLDSDFDDAEKEFLLRCQGGLKLVTKFWKNVRKPQAGEEPIQLRYLLVAERHISGLPHYHALVHEVAGNVTYRRLASRWTRYGFFHAKLVDNKLKAARYLTKYVAKSNLSRVRASERYGLQLEDLSEIASVEQVLDWLGDSPSL